MKLTDRDYQTLAAIADFVREHGFSPSIRDIIANTDHVSTSTVTYCLRKLKHKGLINRVEGITRSITMTEAGFTALLDKVA